MPGSVPAHGCAITLHASIDQLDIVVDCPADKRNFRFELIQLNCGLQYGPRVYGNLLLLI